MHVAIATVFAPYAFKKGSTLMRGKKEDWKMWEWTCHCPWVFFEYVLFVCIYVCVYWRNNEDAMWSSQSLSWKCGLTYFISLIWKCVHSVICYTYCYIFDMLSLTTGLPMWNCSYFFLFIFPPPPQRFLTVHKNMVPFSLTKPVIIVHRVNLTLFYFASVFLF